MVFQIWEVFILEYFLYFERKGKIFDITNHKKLKSQHKYFILELFIVYDDTYAVVSWKSLLSCLYSITTVYIVVVIMITIIMVVIMMVTIMIMLYVNNNKKKGIETMTLLLLKDV